MSPIDRELERALARRAAGVEPPAGLLTTITKEASAMRRRRQGAVAGAALSVLAIAIAVPLLLRDDKPNDSGLAGDPTPTASAPASVEPSPDETPTAAESTAPPAVMAAVPVYYIRDTGRAFHLYREFHRADIASGRALAAAREAVTRPPVDADYTSKWPAGSAVNAVTVSGDTATVDLNAAATSATNTGSSAESAALQALVYAVTAADTSVKKVLVTVDGKPGTTLWGHVDISEPVARAPQQDVLAPVWLLQPEPGATVDRTFTIGGQATVFEATVSWEVYAGGTKVASGFDTATQGAPGRGDWSSAVTIPASVPSGTVLEIRAFESSAEDGRPLFTDTKSVTLR